MFKFGKITKEKDKLVLCYRYMLIYHCLIFLQSFFFYLFATLWLYALYCIKKLQMHCFHLKNVMNIKFPITLNLF